MAETEPGRWHLEIPQGPAGAYRWAQLDDHLHLARKDFPWQLQMRLGLRMQLRARVSANLLPGTWGFGFWNDPFTASLGVSGTARRLPALPNAVWYFFAGAPNYLAFQDTHPAQGFLAATFRSSRLPTLLLAPGALAAPLLFIRPAARLLRRMARLLIHEDGAVVPGDPTDWHTYGLTCDAQGAVFEMDGIPIFRTAVTPRGPLGLVIWIDNQYAAFPPSGKLAMGTSPNPEPAWLEVEGLLLEAQSRTIALTGARRSTNP